MHFLELFASCARGPFDYAQGREEWILCLVNPGLRSIEGLRPGLSSAVPPHPSDRNSGARRGTDSGT